MILTVRSNFECRQIKISCCFHVFKCSFSQGVVLQGGHQSRGQTLDITQRCVCVFIGLHMSSTAASMTPLPFSSAGESWRSPLRGDTGTEPAGKLRRRAAVRLCRRQPSRRPAPLCQRQFPEGLCLCLDRWERTS